jgi:hypothetical protein
MHILKTNLIEKLEKVLSLFRVWRLGYLRVCLVSFYKIVFYIYVLQNINRKLNYVFLRLENLFGGVHEYQQELLESQARPRLQESYHNLYNFLSVLVSKYFHTSSAI